MSHTGRRSLILVVWGLGMIALAWSLLSEEQQHDARTAIRALALSIGNDESLTDQMVH